MPGELATFLDARREPLVNSWIEALRQNQRAGYVPKVDDPGLIDHLPHLFDDLLASLRGEPAAFERTIDDALAHGQVRWGQHYSLNQVLHELGIVSHLLFEHGFDAFAEVHAELDRAALRSARKVILSFFEDTASGSAQQYVARQQEAANELSELRRLALDSAQMGTWHFDLATERVHWDDQFKRIFGVADEELSYERVVALLHPDDREHVRVAIAAASRPDDPIPYAIEYRVRQPDNSWRWVQAHGKTYYEGKDGARRAIRLVGTVRDVTRSKVAQEAVRNSEAKYRSLFDSIDQAFAVLDIIRDEQDRPVDYRFVEVNPAMERHTGWQDARGKTARELIPNLENHWPERYGRVERTGEPTRFVEGAEGMGRVFDAYAFRIGSADHPQVAILFQDVTEQRAAAATLAQMSEQRRLALDSAQLGWWHYDPATGTVDWDERTRAFYGSEAERVTTNQVTAAIHPDDVEARNAAFQAAMQPGNVNPHYEVEYRVKLPGGAWRWLQVKGKATFAGEGSEHHVVSMDGTVGDVTAAKAAQEALRAREAASRFLADMGEATRQTADPDAVLGVVVDLLRTHLAADRCVYAEVDENQDITVIRYDRTDPAGSNRGVAGLYQLSGSGKQMLPTTPYV